MRLQARRIFALVLTIGFIWIYIKFMQSGTDYHVEPTRKPIHRHHTVKVISNSSLMVVLVTYQRSGSTFLSELFNNNPDAIAWFEPLDGVYTAMYGIQYGGNVPSNIWNHNNGSTRHLPLYEEQAVIRVLTDILTCNFQEVPIEVLFHEFLAGYLIHHKNLKKYVECAKAEKGQDIASYVKCNKMLAEVCGNRFGNKHNKQNECASLLLPHVYSDDDWGEFIKHKIQINASTEVKDTIEKYMECVKPCRERAKTCLHHLTGVCEAAKIRSLKPVRLQMPTVKKLLKILPQIKIIHNLRDPRAVLVSRQTTSVAFQANFAVNGNKFDIIKEATLLCRNVNRDKLTFNALTDQFPNSSIQVIHEHYSKHPQLTANTVYNFLGTEAPNEVIQWLDENTKNSHSKLKTTKDSVKASSHWKNILSEKAETGISQVCSNHFIPE